MSATALRRPADDPPPWNVNVSSSLGANWRTVAYLPIKSALLPVMSGAVRVSTSARLRAKSARFPAFMIAAVTSCLESIARRMIRQAVVTVRSDFCMSRTVSAARAAVLFSALRANDPISLSNMNRVAPAGRQIADMLRRHAPPLSGKSLEHEGRDPFRQAAIKGKFANDLQTINDTQDVACRRRPRSAL